MRWSYLFLTSAICAASYFSAQSIFTKTSDRDVWIEPGADMLFPASTDFDNATGKGGPRRAGRIRYSTPLTGSAGTLFLEWLGADPDGRRHLL